MCGEASMQTGDALAAGMTHCVRGSGRWHSADGLEGGRSELLSESTSLLTAHTTPYWEETYLHTHCNYISILRAAIILLISEHIDLLMDPTYMPI